MMARSSLYYSLGPLQGVVRRYIHDNVVGRNGV